jgi:hypothetical protein
MDDIRFGTLIANKNIKYPATTKLSARAAAAIRLGGIFKISETDKKLMVPPIYKEQKI